MLCNYFSLSIPLLPERHKLIYLQKTKKPKKVSSQFSLLFTQSPIRTLIDLVGFAGSFYKEFQIRLFNIWSVCMWIVLLRFGQLPFWKDSYVGFTSVLGFLCCLMTLFRLPLWTLTIFGHWCQRNKTKQKKPHEDRWEVLACIYSLVHLACVYWAPLCTRPQCQSWEWTY